MNTWMHGACHTCLKLLYTARTLLLVGAQVCVIREALQALGTLEGLGTCMFVHVTRVQIFLRKLSTTEMALKRLVSGMVVDVQLEAVLG